MIEFEINYSILKAVHLFATKDECRHILQGVYAEWSKKSGLILVATDGRCMMVFQPSEAEVTIQEPGSFIIPSKLLNAIRVKNRITNNTRVRFNPASGFVRITDIAEGLSMQKKVVDGVYPKWREVVPTQKTVSIGCKSAVNPHLLVKFQAASDLIFGKNTVVMWQENAIDPIFLTNTSPDFLGILMPMRTSETKFTYPNWL